MEYLLSQKGELLLFLSKQQGDLINDSIKIFDNYQFKDLIELLKEINDQDYNIFKFIYPHRKQIHSLLYNYDETINLKEFRLIFDFEELYYLDLLINENEEIINYTYDLKILNSYENVVKKNNNSNYFIVIVSCKIILDLIKNFCDSDNYEEINLEEIDKIKNEVEDIFKNNINKFKEKFNINEIDVKEMKLEEIYCKIIISLIKSNKFDDYYYLNNIFNELELEKIDIGNAILQPLKEILDENNEHIKQFVIKTKNDFLDEKKINFYYFLFRYIFKKSYFIYQIDFLLKTKKRLKGLIKSINYKNMKLSEEILERFRYVLEFFLDSKYYLEQNKEEINQLKIVLKYFKTFFFESKLKEIKKIEEDIKNKNVDSEYLKYYQEAVEGNNIYPIIKEIFYTSHNRVISSEFSLKQSLESWGIVNKTIKAKKLNKLRNKEIYYQYFNDKKNHELLLKVFTQEEIDFFINSVKSKNKIKISKQKHEINNEIKNENKNEIIEEEIIEDGSAPAPFPSIIKYDKPNNEDVQNKEINSNIKLKKEIAKVNETNIIKNEIIPEKENRIAKKDNNKSNKDSQKNQNFESTKSKTHDKDNDKEDKGEEPKNDFKSTIKIIANKETKNIEYKEIKMGKNNIEFNNIEQFIQNLNKLNESKEYEWFEDFTKEVENKIKTNFDYSFQLELEIKIESKKKNFDAKFSFNDPINKNKYSYKEENININGTDSNLQGFNFLLRDINQDKYKYLYYNVDKPRNEDIEIVKNIKEIPGLYNRASDDEILEIIKIIENKNGDNGFIKEVNNDYYIYAKTDNTVVLLDQKFNPVMEIMDYSDKIINVCTQFRENEFKKENENVNNAEEYSSISETYLKPKKSKSKNSDKSTKEKSESKEDDENSEIGETPQGNKGSYKKNEFSTQFSEKKINQKENKEIPKDKEESQSQSPKKYDDLKIVLLSNNYLYLTKINLNEKKTETTKVDITRVFGFSTLEIKKNNFLIVGKKCTTYITDLFTNAKPQEILYIENQSFFNSLRVGEHAIALISNSVYPGGEDVLKFFKLKKKKDFYQREHRGYSFIISPNGLELMPKLKYVNDYKILLCACKKYTKEQKNGILLVNTIMNEKDVENPFYDTDNFEVFCFCPLLVEEDGNKIEDEGGGNLIDTNYFLVGGFDNDLREGKIRLYKINYGKKAYNTTIEYVQDIDFKEKDDIEAFNGPINCLIQSKRTGNILASCSNGNIYLLTPPNINYYLEEDKNMTD